MACSYYYYYATVILATALTGLSLMAKVTSGAAIIAAATSPSETVSTLPLTISAFPQAKYIPANVDWACAIRYNPKFALPREQWLVSMELPASCMKCTEDQSPVDQQCVLLPSTYRHLSRRQYSPYHLRYPYRPRYPYHPRYPYYPRYPRYPHRPHHRWLMARQLTTDMPETPSDVQTESMSTKLDQSLSVRCLITAAKQKLSSDACKPASLPTSTKPVTINTNTNNDDDDDDDDNDDDSSNNVQDKSVNSNSNTEMSKATSPSVAISQSMTTPDKSTECTSATGCSPSFAMNNVPISQQIQQIQHIQMGSSNPPAMTMPAPAATTAPTTATALEPSVDHRDLKYQPMDQGSDATSTTATTATAMMPQCV
ncbi:hypothetical protein BDF22DRAFT_673086 [Syncephalis plumigaleata]|nr:hypothetical protein BDF22DRAFT_673086 [Syncephalis plumigaleata]